MASNNKKNTFEQHDNEIGSFYHHSVSRLKYEESLNSDLKFDVCIIGGGLSGISTALNLSNKGIKVALVEARKIGWGASGRNGGQLGIGMRKDQFFLEDKLGKNNARELWKLGLEAVNETKSLIKKYNINCHLVPGILNAGFYRNDEKHFLEEINHMQKNYNFNDYKFIDNKNIKNEINSDRYYSGLLNNSSYHINPMKLLIGLLEELLKKNVKIFENTPVLKIDDYKDQIKLTTKNGTLKSNFVVSCCNGYLDKLLGKVRNKFMPINNYVIATEKLGAKEAKKLIRNNYAVSDTRFIIDYFRFSEDWRMIFGGGETYTSDFMHNSKNFVRKRMLKVFPTLKKVNIDFSWGGTLAITVNRLPDFGTLLNGKLIYVHGYSGHGLALSILAGKLVSEKINGFNERFKFFEEIKHLTIPGGDLLRRPIYSSAIAYYKLRDLL